MQSLHARTNFLWGKGVLWRKWSIFYDRSLFPFLLETFMLCSFQSLCKGDSSYQPVSSFQIKREREKAERGMSRFVVSLSLYWISRKTFARCQYMSPMAYLLDHLAGIWRGNETIYQCSFDVRLQWILIFHPTYISFDLFSVDQVLWTWSSMDYQLCGPITCGEYLLLLW